MTIHLLSVVHHDHELKCRVNANRPVAMCCWSSSFVSSGNLSSEPSVIRGVARCEGFWMHFSCILLCCHPGCCRSEAHDVIGWLQFCTLNFFKFLSFVRCDRGGWSMLHCSQGQYLCSFWILVDVLCLL